MAAAQGRTPQPPHHKVPRQPLLLDRLHSLPLHSAASGGSHAGNNLIHAGHPAAFQLAEHLRANVRDLSECCAHKLQEPRALSATCSGNVVDLYEVADKRHHEGARGTSQVAYCMTDQSGLCYRLQREPRGKVLEYDMHVQTVRKKCRHFEHFRS